MLPRQGKKPGEEGPGSLACRMMSEEEVSFRNLHTRGAAREGRGPGKEEKQFKDPNNGKGLRKLGPKWEGGGEQTQWPPGFLFTSNCLSLASKEFPTQQEERIARYPHFYPSLTLHDPTPLPASFSIPH